MYLIRLVFFTLALSVSTAFADVQKTQVAALDGRNCNTYLFVKGSGTPAFLALQMWGNGIYTNSTEDTIHDGLVPLYEKGSVAVLTFDKPGISPNPDPKAKAPLVDNAIFDQHTQRDLIACAKNSLAWAATSPFVTKNPKILFVGHSEGSQLAIRTYAELLKEKNPIGTSVEALLLSGVPMKLWKDIIDFQLKDSPDRDAFWKAYYACDNDYLREFGAAGCKYLQDIFATESTVDTLRSLWDVNPKATFEIFQGLNDHNTEIQPVIDFDTENRARIKDNKSALDWQARYYDGAHGLNGTAKNDFYAIVQMITEGDAK